MRPCGSPEELKVRRIEAAKMLRQGKSQSEVARLVGASSSSVHRWKQALDRAGLKGLNCKRRRTPKRKLSPGQRGDLKRTITDVTLRRRRGLPHFDCERSAVFIRKRYGVSYHPSYIGRLLRSLGLSDEELNAAGFDTRPRKQTQ